MKGYVSEEAIIKNGLTLVAAIIVLAIVAQMPELVRYLKIRSM